MPREGPTPVFAKPTSKILIDAAERRRKELFNNEPSVSQAVDGFHQGFVA